jgi:hypothetical protein
MRLSHIPLRAVTGAYILHAGIQKWSGDEVTAKAIHGMASPAPTPSSNRCPPPASSASWPPAR